MSNTGYLLPLTNVPQTFNISIAGIAYTITCKWNDAPDAGWVLDIADQLTNTPLACGIPLITGADLLDGLEYLGINGQLYVYTNGDQYAVPTLDNLGIDSNVYFVTSVPSGG